jgi:hypothetical protein
MINRFFELMDYPSSDGAAADVPEYGIAVSEVIRPQNHFAALVEQRDHQIAVTAQPWRQRTSCRWSDGRVNRRDHEDAIRLSPIQNDRHFVLELLIYLSSDMLI